MQFAPQHIEQAVRHILGPGTKSAVHTGRLMPVGRDPPRCARILFEERHNRILDFRGGPAIHIVMEVIRGQYDKNG